MRPLYSFLLVVLWALAATVRGQSPVVPQELRQSRDQLSALAGGARAEAPRIEVFSSPHGGCTDQIVNLIDAAKREVLVEAFRFDSKVIAKALIKAKKEHHVDVVQVLLDKRHRADKKDVAADLRAADIPTMTYAPPYGIDHNKVIVIDRKILITGSFNFTEQAEANAENLIIIRDGAIAADYAAKWNLRAAHSDAQTMANAAKATEIAAKAVAKAVNAARAKTNAYAKAEAAWAEVEEAWDKAEKEATADAKSTNPTVAKWAAVGLRVTTAAKLAARKAKTTAEAAKEAWTKAATVEQVWAEAEAAWAEAAKQAAEQVAAETKTAKQSEKALNPLFAKAQAGAEAADQAWAEAVAKGAAHTKAADETDTPTAEAEKAADAADAAIKQAAGGR